MSEIRVTTVSDTAGTGPVTLTKQHAAKAWVNFNGTGTIAARDSFNVASLTDSSTGNYSVNFSNNFSDGNYASVATQGNADASNPGSLGTHTVGHTASNLSSIETCNSNTGSNNDWAQISHISHGDLA